MKKTKKNRKDYKARICKIRMESKMEKQTIGIIAVILGVLVLLVVSFLALNQPKIPECPKCPSLTCPEQPVVVQEKEVVKEVEVEVQVDYKDKVVSALVEEIKSDKALRRCDDVKYSSEEIEVKKVYSGFVVEEDNEDEVFVSDVRVKLNYDKGKCYRTLICELDSDSNLYCEED